MSHIKHFGLKNFRVFKDQTDFELAPITIVTGKNNSGKSSLSKALTLLSDTFSIKTKEHYNLKDLKPFGYLNFSRNDIHYLGSQKFISNRDGEDITFTFNTDIQLGENKFDKDWTVEISYYNDSNVKAVYGAVKSFRIYKNNNNVITDKLVDIELSYEIDKSKLYKLDCTIRHKYNYQYIFMNSEYDIMDCVPIWSNKELLSMFIIGDIDYSTTFITMLELLSDELKTGLGVDQAINFNYITESFAARFGGYGWEWLSIKSDNFFNKYIKKLKEKGININDKFLSDNKEKNIRDFFKNEDSIENFRIHVFEGILMKIVNDSILKFEQIIYIPKDRLSLSRIQNREAQNFITKEKEHLLLNPNSGIFFNNKEFEIEKKWCIEFGIEDFKFEDIEGSSFKLSINTDGEYRNMADVGFGYSQLSTLMYILFSINKTFKPKDNWTIFRDIGKNIIILEEPENGLHPNLQSKLAEFFVELYLESGFQFIIETHSEYLIRKLQLLTAQKKIQSSDTIIHYLFHPNSENAQLLNEQVRTIRIRENGYLTKELGSGFLDEADNMALNIYQLNMN